MHKRRVIHTHGNRINELLAAGRTVLEHVDQRLLEQRLDLHAVQRLRRLRQVLVQIIEEVDAKIAAQQEEELVHTVNQPRDVELLVAQHLQQQLVGEVERLVNLRVILRHRSHILSIHRHVTPKLPLLVHRVHDLHARVRHNAEILSTQQDLALRTADGGQLLLLTYTTQTLTFFRFSSNTSFKLPLNASWWWTIMNSYASRPTPARTS